MKKGLLIVIFLVAAMHLLNAHALLGAVFFTTSVTLVIASLVFSALPGEEGGTFSTFAAGVIGLIAWSIAVGVDTIKTMAETFA